MPYRLYLGTMLAPVAPSKIQIKIKNQNKTINLINDGEVNIIKSAGLSEISFSLLIPFEEEPFAEYKSGFRKQSEFLNDIEKLKISNQPFQFIVTRTTLTGQQIYDTNLKVTLEDYSINEDAGKDLDVVVDIKLKQYKSYGTKIAKVVTPKKVSVASARESTSQANNQLYTVVSGDTLWGIAQRFYGDGTKWTKIYNANKDLIEKVAWERWGTHGSNNGHWIFPGTKLTIPA